MVARGIVRYGRGAAGRRPPGSARRASGPSADRMDSLDATDGRVHRNSFRTTWHAFVAPETKLQVRLNTRRPDNTGEKPGRPQLPFAHRAQEDLQCVFP